MNKLQSAAKQLDEAAKELEKDQQTWKLQQGELQRKQVELTAKNTTLRSQNEMLTKDQHLLETVNAKLVERQAELVASITAHEEKLIELDAKFDASEARYLDKMNQLTEVRAELTRQKASFDKDLEAYGDSRKQEIKQAILQTNDELVANRAELKVLQDEIAAKEQQLAELNTVYIEEAEQLKQSTTATNDAIEANRQKVAETQAEIDKLIEERNKIAYDFDNFQITMSKARAEHDNFLEYERKAKKILDAKDRELQSRQAEMATQSQFLKNSRSFLPEL